MNAQRPADDECVIPLLPADVPLTSVRYIGVSLIEQVALFDDGTSAGCCWRVPLQTVKTWPGFDVIASEQRASILAWRARSC